MNVAQEVELLSLIEGLDDDDLPAAASAIVDAWCRRRGVDRRSLQWFLERLIDTQIDDDVRYSMRSLLVTQDGA